MDFLNHQSVEGVGSVNEPTNRSERILFAERLGALNLSWLVLQAKIDSEVSADILYNNAVLTCIIC